VFQEGDVLRRFGDFKIPNLRAFEK